MGLCSVWSGASVVSASLSIIVGTNASSASVPVMLDLALCIVRNPVTPERKDSPLSLRSIVVECLWYSTIVSFLCFRCICVMSVMSAKVHSIIKWTIKIELKNEFLILNLIFDVSGGARKGEGGVNVDVIGS